MKKTPIERLADVAQKLADREAKRAAVLEKHKPPKGKKLTTDQRLARIEEYLGIKDD